MVILRHFCLPHTHTHTFIHILCRSTSSFHLATDAPHKTRAPTMDKRNLLPDENEKKKEKPKANVVNKKMKNSRNGWKICSNKAYTDVVNTKAWEDESTKKKRIFFHFTLCIEKENHVSSIAFFHFLPQMEIIIETLCRVIFSFLFLDLCLNECFQSASGSHRICTLYRSNIVSFAIECQHHLTWFICTNFNRTNATQHTMLISQVKKICAMIFKVQIRKIYFSRMFVYFMKILTSEN